MAESIQINIEQVKERVQAACRRVGRRSEDVTILAVTKYVSVERAKEALDAGITHLGESRSEGFLEKYHQVEGNVNWHFIGRLQSRKVKDIINYCDYIHSLDRLSLAKEIEKRSEKNEPISCMVQVNVSGEETKAGVRPEELLDFVRKLEAYKSIRVSGLMTMAPHEENPERTRPHFKKLSELAADIRELGLSHAPCTHLSMGMSNDFEQAVEEGATMIRLGSSIVGSSS